MSWLSTVLQWLKSKPTVQLLLAASVLIFIVGALVITVWQMYRGDALQCADGSLFAKTCDPPSFPEGAVVAFEQEECPQGWREHDDSAGRFIIGVELNPPDDEPVLHLGMRDGAPRTESLLDGLGFVSLDGGGSYSVYTDRPESLPPYIALRFCTPD